MPVFRAVGMKLFSKYLQNHFVICDPVKGK